jgi:hypothetical protein
VAVLTTAIGFQTASLSDPEAAGEATLTADIVTESGFGRVAGGVNSPVDEIVPVAVAPPTTPFTCHVTAGFVLFPTVAVSCTVDPRRTELAPVTATVTVGVGVAVVDPPAPPHPASRPIDANPDKPTQIAAAHLFAKTSSARNNANLRHGP